MSHYVKDDDPPWSRCSTLQEWVCKGLREGKEAEVLSLIQNLPEERRAPYREIYRQWRLERDGKQKPGAN